ncbi:hypothetical protein KVT40_005164 [Elsinoe batatas]|uniref:Oxidase ustYa n=1 Tax=Elsinoe batatas TaxID=2601811 RepID=A0A8K0PI31_9PEZI|nr:hypothetical protein KVT40_005164 [Elsinoe batatas]
MVQPEENDEEKQAFLTQSLSSLTHNEHSRDRQTSQSVAQYLRILLEIVLAGSVVYLLLRPHPAGSEAAARTSPVPTFPRKTYAFLANSTFLNDDMFSSEMQTRLTLHNWLPLSSEARGYVHLPDAAHDFPDLVEPFQIPLDRFHEGPGYMVSVFHQLHCLSYLIQHFQTGFAGANLTQEVAHHSAHCFDYLRQAIMCAGDTTLEGKTDAGPGWGSPHQCVDYDSVLEWANANGAQKWRGTMPDELAIL